MRTRAQARAWSPPLRAGRPPNKKVDSVLKEILASGDTSKANVLAELENVGNPCTYRNITARLRRLRGSPAAEQKLQESLAKHIKLGAAATRRLARQGGQRKIKITTVTTVTTVSPSPPPPHPTKKKKPTQPAPRRTRLQVCASLHARRPARRPAPQPARCAPARCALG